MTILSINKEAKIEIDLKPIETKKRYVLVIDKISELIKNGTFKINDKLPPERIMSKKLGVSRPSVREAYSSLEIAGILESKVGSGTFVKSDNFSKISKNKLKDISTKEESPYEIISLRKILEPEIVVLAAKNAKTEDLEELEKILSDMKAEIQKGKSYSLDMDYLFHITIAKASGNSVFLIVLQYILELTKERLWQKIRSEIVKDPNHLIKDIKYHEDIFECMKNKDYKNARKIMRKHFDDIQKEIVQDNR